MLPEPLPRRTPGMTLSPEDRFAVAAWNALTAVLEAACADDLRAIHAGLVLDAGAWAAQLAEEIARPDERWGPERNGTEDEGGAA